MSDSPVKQFSQYLNVKEEEGGREGGISGLSRLNATGLKQTKRCT